MPKTLEEMKVRHKREIKSVEGEKLAAMKNAKSRGKKAKAAIKDAEFKYEALQRDLMERHRLETDQLINKEEYNISDSSGQHETTFYEDENAPVPTAQTTPKEEE